MDKKNSQKKFDLTDNFKDMFKSTDPANNTKGEPVSHIATEKLISFKNHPFKLYEGERFDDMVKSIKENGIILPIIVRPIKDDLFEILSGHNRTKAAKSIGLETVPSIIRKNLSDEDALLIVTETNLLQRSFNDLSHSEKATALAVHYEAIKNQGKRTDLINEIENYLENGEDISNNANNDTGGHIVRKLTSRDIIADNYGLNYRTVSRYVRINRLIEPLKELIDNNKIPFLAGVELSYLSVQNQTDLYDCLSNNPAIKINIKKSRILRESSKDNKLNSESINNILSGIGKQIAKNKTIIIQPLKIKSKVLSKYFRPEQTPEEIQSEIIEAIEFYRANK